MPKRVLHIVIDALAPAVLLPAMEAGRLPTFQALAKAGMVSDRCCSIFPSITHACLSSIATGKYPVDHGIVGSFWYEEDNEDIAYYGAQPWIVLNQGLNKFVDDLLDKMNSQRLKAPTTFEMLADAGKTSACLNHLIYRGTHAHKVHEPTLMKLIPFVKASRTVCGPETLFLGDFVPLTIGDEEIEIEGGASNRFGMRDEGTFAALRAMAERDAFPDYTLAYFPDNDVESHDKGPHGAFPCLEAIDRGLYDLFARMGGIEAVLDHFAIFIHGDHAQTEVKEGEDVGGIDLTELIDGCRFLTPGQPLDCPEDVLIAPNLRTSFFYLGETTKEARDRVAGQLIASHRIDQVIWQADTFDPGVEGFWVVTESRGGVRFWKGNSGPMTAEDEYGTAWSWEGELSAVDARVEGNRLIWGDYPNAFERIACGVGPKYAGHVWATAKLGHSFKVPFTKAHSGGGSHASLHAGDSHTALIVSGLPEGVAVPEHPRIVDLSPLALEILNAASNQR